MWIVTEISIHAPAKGATKSTGNQAQQSGISIHAPTKGATSTGIRGCRIYRHFNPRSREGSDLSNFIPNVFFINFNPRSREGSDATIPTNCNRYDRISIHAPAKGATELHWVPMQWLLYFNPRSREGSDITSVKAHTL